MKQTIGYRCTQCGRTCEIDARQGDFSCPHCATRGGKIDHIETVFDRCVICQCRQFYLVKDFNRALGCSILLVSIVLVPWTYGLSLPVLALIDWMLYKRVPTRVNCYKCDSAFRGFDYPKHLKSFSHPTALQYNPF